MSCCENKRQIQPSPTLRTHHVITRGRGCYDPAVADQKVLSNMQRKWKERYISLDCMYKESISYAYLDNVPRILASVTELAACHAGTQAVVADTDRFVFEGISKVILPFRHGSNEDADALVGSQRVDIIPDSYYVGVETEGHFPAIRWQVVGDGVLDDFQQLFLRIHRPNGESMEQLHHETGEALERSGNADRRADLDQYTLCGVDEDLQFPGLVDGGVKQSEKTLYVEVSSSLPRPFKWEM